VGSGERLQIPTNNIAVFQKYNENQYFLYKQPITSTFKQKMYIYIFFFEICRFLEELMHLSLHSVLIGKYIF